MNKKLFYLFRLVTLLLTSAFFIPAKAIAQEARIIANDTVRRLSISNHHKLAGYSYNIFKYQTLKE